jgi:hypothetical protein
MAIQKIVDDMRTTTVLDAAKVTTGTMDAAITVTAGQALSYEISFAGQSASLETRVHGVAMTY